jgi:enhancing lycopene biosynthesis protein 2
MSSTAPAKKVAVILAGCGVYDGSEITESVSILLSLSQRGADVTCFAPDANTAHVVNHTAGAPAEGETRNMLTESNRIARGDAKPLSALDAAAFDALVMPGGFGVMKNLSNFAFEGPKGAVREDVAAAILAFRAAEKPIGGACIAPILLAKVLTGAKLTLGPNEGDAFDLAQTFDGKNTIVACAADKCVVDEAQKVVSAPAYMCGEATRATVFASIDSMVGEVLKRA